MDYIRWRNDIFGKPPGSDPVTIGLLAETYAVSKEESFDHIDRALTDPEIHDYFSKDQIGIGLKLIYCNCCSNLPACYTESANDLRRILGIRNLKKLYSNYFERYCLAPVRSIGNDRSDGVIGYVCFMFWDIFLLYPGNASTGMVDAGFEVMEHGIRSRNDNCIASAIHGLGDWSFDSPRAAQILRSWLKAPTTYNGGLLDYAERAITGSIM